MQRLLLIVALISIAFAAVGNPPECSHYDCPEFSVLWSNETAGLEIRSLPAQRWVSTTVQSFYLAEAENVGFERLFGYISGDNEAGESIPMTAPVQVLIVPGEGPFCQSNFTVSFYVPADMQSGSPPPAPTDPSVFINYQPAVIYAVQKFSGYSSTWDEIKAPSESLINFISHDMLPLGWTFTPNIESVAGYDPPFRPIDRHNEIWISVQQREAAK